MNRKMKDSGVEWIGEIPEGWRCKRLKAVLQERVEKNNPVQSTYILSLTNEKGVIPYEEKGNVGNKAKEDVSGYHLAYPNDIVLNSMNVVIGSVGLSKYYGCVSPVYYMLNKRDEGHDIRYYNYIFQTSVFQQNLKGLGNGILEIRMRIPMSKLNVVMLPVPENKEQQRIADFLDSQTAEIDASIAKTQESIEEYKKLKQAVITQAVTKGIRPGRAMKDSGVEWIGEIPENWEMDKAIRLWKARKGSNAALLTSEYCGQHHGPYPVYSGQTENDGIMGMIDSFAFDVGDEGCLFSTTVGAKAMSVAHLTNKFSLSQNCMIMQRENSNVCVRYFYFFFTHEFAYNRSLIPDYMQPSFRVKDFNAFPVLLPSYEEQQEIAAYLDEKCAAIDTLIEKKQAIITELEAYKKSLIYEYVTGKKEVPQGSTKQ